MRTVLLFQWRTHNKWKHLNGDEPKWLRSSLNPMADYTMLIIYASIALGVSFLCSLLEAVLLSMPVSHVSVIGKEGNKNGLRWSKLKEDDSVKPLTAILTLNTIAHTMGAAGRCRRLSAICECFFDSSVGYPYLGCFNFL